MTTKVPVTYEKVSQMPKGLVTAATALAEKAVDNWVVKMYGTKARPYGEGQIVDPAAVEAFSQFKRAELAKALMSRGFTGHPAGIVVDDPTDKQKEKMPKIDKPVPTPQKPATVVTRKTEDVMVGDVKFRAGTITHRVFTFLDLPADKALTRGEMLDVLCTEFPDHSREDIAVTLGCQIQRVPGRVGRELGRNAEGKYSFNIQGYDGTREVSPEQAEKRAALEKEKEEKKAAKVKAREEKAAALEKEKAEKAAAKETARLQKEKEKAEKDAAAAKAKAEAEAAKAKAAQEKALADAKAAKEKAELLAKKAKEDAANAEKAAKIAALNAKSKSAPPPARAAK